MPPPEIDLTTELEKLTTEVFSSIPEQERKEIKLGDRLKFEPLIFDPDELSNPDNTEHIASYSLYIKKVTYEVLLFTQKHKLHLLTQSSNLLKKLKSAKQQAKLLLKIFNRDKDAAFIQGCFLRLPNHMRLPLVVDFQSYQLCKRLVIFASQLLSSGHAYSEDIEKYIKPVNSYIKTYLEYFSYTDKEYIDDLFLQLNNALDNLNDKIHPHFNENYLSLHMILTVTLFNIFNNLTKDSDIELQNNELITYIQQKTGDILKRIMLLKNISQDMNNALQADVAFCIKEMLQKTRDNLSPDKDKKSEIKATPEKERKREAKELATLREEADLFRQKIDDLSSYASVFNIFQIIHQRSFNIPLAEFYSLEIANFLKEVPRSCDFFAEPLQHLNDEKIKFRDLLDRQDIDKLQAINDTLQTAKKLLTPTADTLLEIFNEVNDREQPLENKKQFSKQIAVHLLPKITSLAEMAKLVELLNKRDFLRQERGGLFKNCITSYGDTASFKFVLSLTQKQIEKLAKNPQQIAHLSQNEKANINQIMNYKKSIFKPTFDINDYHFKSFSDKLHTTYLKQNSMWSFKKPIQESQLKLFTKMIQLLNNPSISADEVKEIQLIFLQNDIAHLSTQEGRYSAQQGFLMNAICQDIIKFKERNASFDIIAAMNRIAQNYTALQKIFSGKLPSLNNILQEMQDSQSRFIRRLKGYVI